MSWLAGFVASSVDAAAGAQWRRFHSTPLHVEETPTAYVAAGGLDATCRAGTLLDGARWFVVGLGLEEDAAEVRFVDEAEWQDRLAPPVPRLDGLDGHFVALRLGHGRLEVWTDGLGLRTLYLAPARGGLAFSTRLDWLAPFLGGTRIDLAACGAHWLAHNAFGFGCLLEGIERLGPGGRAVYAAGRLTTDHAPWSPSVDLDPGARPDRDADLAGRLRSLLRPRARPVSLGLSGGLDSRALLALLLPDPADLQLHLFGAPEAPDAQVARQIAEALGLPQRHYPPPALDPEDAFARMEAYAAETAANTPASAALKLGAYRQIEAAGYVMIDGGFGEIARRQYLNRVLLASLRPRPRPFRLQPRDVGFARVDVFTGEVRQALQRGLAHDLAAAEDHLNALWTEVGRETALDLFAVRTRLPHFFGYEQARLDGLCVNYMPFAQPSVLRAVFATPLVQRRGGRWLRRTIGRAAPILATFPLVKGRQTYPFRLSPLGAHLWTGAQARLRSTPPDTFRSDLLRRLEPQVRDLAGTAARQASLYDAPRLEALVATFYDEGRRAAALDWWLAFELWRRRVEQPSAA